MFTKFQFYIAFVFTIGGSIGTICLKFIDKQKSKDDQTGDEYAFDHPFFQTAVGFVGMSLCFIPHVIIVCIRKCKSCRSTSESYAEIEVSLPEEHTNVYTPFIFLPAAFLNTIAMSIAYFGLRLTYASSYQMLIGSTMIFTGLLSVAFLNSSMNWYRWSGIIVISVGLVSVGLCDYIYTKDNVSLDTYGIITGDLLIIISRIISSVQFVYEEKYMKKHDIQALKIVAWEGIFGFLIMCALFVPLYFIKIPALNKTDPNNRLDNVIAAVYQVINNLNILQALIVFMVAIAFFNYGAMSFTKEFSATSRVVFANLRTITVWSFSMLVAWEEFHALQLLGCIFIIIGTSIYGNVISSLKSRTEAPVNETSPLLVGENRNFS